MPKLQPDEARLLELAQEQQARIADADVRACWTVVVEAIANRWLVPEGDMSLEALIAALERGDGAGAEEYSISVDDEDDRYVIATIATTKHRCDRRAMMRELRSLEARRREEPRSGGSDPAAPGPGGAPPDPELLRSLFQLFAGASSGEVPSHEEGERVRREALDALAQLGDPAESLQSDDARRAIEGLSPSDRERVAGALRDFAAWFEHPEKGGPAVDDAIRMLESTLGWIPQGRRAEEKATQERIARSAQDAIARRLGGDGSDTG